MANRDIWICIIFGLSLCAGASGPASKITLGMIDSNLTSMYIILGSDCEELGDDGKFRASAVLVFIKLSANPRPKEQNHRQLSRSKWTCTGFR